MIALPRLHPTMQTLFFPGPDPADQTAHCTWGPTSVVF